MHTLSLHRIAQGKLSLALGVSIPWVKIRQPPDRFASSQREELRGLLGCVRRFGTEPIAS